MKKSILWLSSLVVLGCLVTVTTGCQGVAETKQASKRVNAVLLGLQSGGGSALARDLNTPVCQWYKGTSLIADQVHPSALTTVNSPLPPDGPKSAWVLEIDS